MEMLSSLGGDKHKIFLVAIECRHVPPWLVPSPDDKGGGGKERRAWVSTPTP